MIHEQGHISDENLYLMEYWPIDLHKLRRLDFHQLNWVPCEKTMEEYSLFHSFLKHGDVVKPKSWPTPSSPYRRFFDTDTPGKGRCISSTLWYFPQDCLNVTLLDE
ncbi:unnamed protein product [Lactuca virosa]|uniref:Uncharacterized protein n=1 Tax=Lactuca virosa TaxID=75947 RepID=A0AAU9NIL9_9ASTR|nr:unnamed protein product [Lactuca virosa]